MARKDPKHTEIYKEVKRLRAKLYKAKKELHEAKGSNSRNMAQGDIDELKRQIAWFFLDAGEYEKGLVLYRSMSWKMQGEIKYLGLGRALTGIGYYGEAVKLLNKGLGRFPESSSLLVAMGNVYHQSGDYSKSLKYFEQALAFDPGDKLILFSKANALYGLKLYEDALPVYQNLADQYPDESLFSTQVGYCHLQMGYPEDASGHFKSLLSKGCAGSDDYNGLFCAYYDMGLLDDAIETAHEGIRKFPEDDSALYCNTGVAYFEQGRLDDAKNIVSEGLKKFPEDGGLKEMLKAIEDAIDNPDDDDKKPPIKEILIIAALIKKLRNKKAFRPKK